MNEVQSVWSERARRFGRRAAVNLAIQDDQMDAETKRVEAELFPMLRGELTSAPRWLLDYGCGWGRFTADLAAEVRAAHTIGYDPTPELIAMARPVPAVDVRFVSSPVEEFFETLDVRFDLIWIQAVLGGISNDELPALANRLCAVLSAGGLLFLVEDTHPIGSNNSFWHVREQRYFLELFDAPGVSIRVLGTMPTGFGGTKSIFAVRKNA
jgi:ubiquinone/menaquinone biosynthesis C-methylase UbiE